MNGTDMEERVSVLMTKEDAALFVLFNQYYDSIGFLIGSRALDIKKGSVTLDFDSSGKLQRVTRTLSTSRADLPLELSTGL